MARRVYTEADQAFVAVTLQVNDGNIRRTARETNVPVATVRDWKTKWDTEGYPENLEGMLPVAFESFLDQAKHVRNLMVERLQQKVERDQASARDLITGIGVLTDKINVITGLTNKQSQTTVNVNLPDAGELAKELAAYVSRTVEASHDRHEAIEAEWTEVSQPVLTQGTSE